MADFTINSLSTGSFAGTDNFLKSDQSGGLTKLPGSSLKNAMIGSVDITNAGASVTEAIKDIGIGTKYATLTSDKINSSCTLKRAGRLCTMEIVGNTLAAAITEARTQILSIPEGYRPAIETSGVGITVSADSSHAVCPVQVVATAAGTFRITSGPIHNGTIPSGTILYVCISWWTKDKMPV